MRKILLMEEIPVCHTLRPITFEKITVSIEKVLKDISELFYKNGRLINTTELVKKSYGLDNPGQAIDRVVNRRLNKNLKTYPSLIYLDEDNGISPLALSLKIISNDMNTFYDLTLVDGFDTNFEWVSDIVIVNICKSPVTLREFLLMEFPNNDPKIVLKCLIEIAKTRNLGNDKRNKNIPIFDTIRDLKTEVSRKLKSYESKKYFLFSKNYKFVGKNRS